MQSTTTNTQAAEEWENKAEHKKERKTKTFKYFIVSFA